MNRVAQRNLGPEVKFDLESQAGCHHVVVQYMGRGCPGAYFPGKILKFEVQGTAKSCTLEQF